MGLLIPLMKMYQTNAREKTVEELSSDFND